MAATKTKCRNLTFLGMGLYLNTCNKHCLEGINQMKKQAVFFLAIMYAFVGHIKAMPVVRNVHLNIDKAAYSSSYSLGIEVSANASLPNVEISSVRAEYLSLNGEKVDSWDLEILTGRWVINPRVWFPERGFNGIPGSFNIMVTDSSGETFTTNDITFPSSAELDVAKNVRLKKDSEGYQLSMDTVSGADRYYWRISDAQSGEAVLTGYANNPSEFPKIPFDALISGKSYNIFGHAHHSFSCGTFDGNSGSLFRTYDYVSFVAVPEPATLLLLCLGGLLIRKR